MGKVIVTNWVTLDGVMQAPGAPDEDTRDGFAHGGWATPFSDPTIGQAMGARMGGDFAWLFGRRTYEDLLASWNARGGPFKDALNGTVKYVASGSGAELAWPRSERVSGDVAARVAELKRETDLVIMGSGVLISTLLRAGLIDELVLMIAPIVLGSGRKLFGDVPADLRLLDCASTGTGVVIATYAA